MICPVAADCGARLAGIAETLPGRKEKTPRPKRAGYVYWITNVRGDVLFEKRQDKGLLGGMIGLPTSEWISRQPRAWPSIRHISAIKEDEDITMAKEYSVRHVFTHFDLELRGVRLSVPDGFSPDDRQFWVTARDIPALGVPTVFRKFIHLMAVKNDG